MSIDYDEWHSGPPPSIGWWPASAVYDYRMLRWWNGRIWSVAVNRIEGADVAGRLARVPSGYSFGPGDVLWRHRPASWPKRSRT